MASFSCGITGELCGEPAVTPSGGVYEKKVIERWISENGNDPDTKEALSKDQLILMKQSPKVTPVPPHSMTISSIIKTLRDEYDATVLCNAKLMKDNNGNNAELIEQLYSHDAAVRVIRDMTNNMKTVKQELEEARKEAEEASATVAAAATEQAAMEQDNEEGITDAILDRISANAKSLTEQRKQRGRKPPADLTSSSEIGKFGQTSNFPALHSASVPGITCLDVNNNVLVTGGNDRNVVVFDKDQQEIIVTCKGHTKSIVNVIHHPSRQAVISASQDSTVRLWNYDMEEEKVNSTKFKFHSDAITDLSLHPTNDFVLTTSKDKSWVFSDINKGTELIRNFDEDNITCGKFHPDGLIFAIGTSRAEVKIWDLKSSTQANAKPAAQPLRGHSGPIEAMAFSENGFHLATASRSNEVRLWDLRRLKNFKTLTLSESFKVRHLEFDKSGQYLCVTGNDVRVFKIKEWNEITRQTKHTDDVTCCKWGVLASEIVTSSLDRTVKIFSKEKTSD